jgi:hypothetical protein
MSAATTAACRGVPRPGRVAEVAFFLGWFFTSGRSAPGRPIRIGGHLWDLLAWCWSLDRGSRDASPLCRRLLRGPGGGWLEERDVLEALARHSDQANPGRLPADEVAGFVSDLLLEGESARGDRPVLAVDLEFMLPRLRQHPHLAAEAMAERLRAEGMSEVRLRAHLEDVHPEAAPYRAAWRLSIRDRDAAPVAAPGPALALPLDEAGLGRRSALSLALLHGAELAAYARASLEAPA